MTDDERLARLEAQFEPVSFWSFSQNWPAYMVLLFLAICAFAVLMGHAE